MLKKHCFIFDSSIGVASEKYPDVFVAPIIINKKVKEDIVSLRDGADITISELSRMQLAGVDFSTAAANPNDIMYLLDHLTKEYENV
jgi:hypothetical protein